MTIVKYLNPRNDIAFKKIFGTEKNKDILKYFLNYEQKWCYFFKHAAQADDMGELLKNSDEVIQKAYHELEAHNWTEEELKAYEASEKVTMDNKARKDFVRENALAEGKAEGGKNKAIEIAKNHLRQK